MISDRSFINTLFDNKIVHPAATAFLLFLLTISCGYAILHSLSWPLTLDPPLMHYIALRILSGDVPYKDIFDMNLPGTYLLHMLVIKVFGPGDYGWRAFDILWLLLTVLATALFCRPLGRWAALFASLFFVAFHLGGGPFALGQRDFMICPFIMFASHFFAKYFEKNNPIRYLFCTGIVLGFAMLIKPQVFLLWIFFLLVYVYKMFARPKWIPGTLMLAGSLAMIPLGVLFWLFSKDALVPFWDLLTGYLPLYSKIYRRSYLEMYQLTLIKHYEVAIVILIGVIIFMGKKLFGNIRLVILMMGVFYGVCHVFSQGKGFIYHRYPFYLFLLALAAIALNDLIHRRQYYYKAIAITSLGVLVILASYRCYVSVKYLSVYAYSKKHSVETLMQDISKYHLTPGDTVQIFATARGGINALYRLGIRQPSRFIYDFHFYHDTDTPFIRKIRSEFVRALTMEAPRLIVIFRWTFLTKDLSRIASFPEFKALLEQKYSIGTTAKRYLIYVSK